MGKDCSQAQIPKADWSISSTKLMIVNDLNSYQNITDLISVVESDPHSQNFVINAWINLLSGFEEKPMLTRECFNIQFILNASSRENSPNRKIMYCENYAVLQSTSYLWRVCLVRGE